MRIGLVFWLILGLLVVGHPAYGKELDLVVDTVPSGARIEWKGNTIGTTPFRTFYPERYFSSPKTVFARVLGESMVVTLYKQGYRPKQVELTHGPFLHKRGSYYLLERVYTIQLEPIVEQPPIATGTKRAISFGTAFHSVRSGYFVTNYHVVEGARKIRISREGNACLARIIASDKGNDLAILKVPDRCVSSLRLGKPFQLGIAGRILAGQEVVTFGFPLPSEFAAEPQISKGIIKSTTGFDGDARTLTISNSVQPGNSGGPLFGPGGNVIAIVTSTANVNYLYPRYQALPQDLNFAVRAEYAMLLFQLNGIQLVQEKTKGLSFSKKQPIGDLPRFVSAIEPNVVLVTTMSGAE